MSIPVIVPGDRGGEATQDVARLLAGIVLPSIESFGPDNAVLVGLPAFVPSVASGPEPLSRVGVARGVYDAALAALAVVKRLEDATAACKAALVGRVLGAAQVEATAVALDRWQSGVAASSACADIALTLCIPERCAAVLAHHATELLTHPGTMAALEAGELSFRHAGIIIDEGQTLAETPGITALDMAAFEARLLVLAPGTTASGFAVKARRARESTHPSTLTTRTKQAYEKRAMTLDPGKDGMSWLTLHLPAVAAEGVWVNCTRTARAIKHQARRAAGRTGQGAGVDSGEYRTLTQLRIDVATALLLNQHPLGENPTGSGPDTSTGTGTGTEHGGETPSGPTASNTPGGPTAHGGSFNTTVGGTQSNGTQAGAEAGTAGPGFSGAAGITGTAEPVEPVGRSRGASAGWTDADAVGGVPFGSKSAFGVTLFDQEPVWAHRDTDEPVGRYVNPDPAPKILAVPEPHPSPDTSPGLSSPPSPSPVPVPGSGVGGGVGFIPDGAGEVEVFTGVVCPGGDTLVAGGTGASGGALNGGPGAAETDGNETTGTDFGGDEVLFGELLGDGSGYVDGVVDGIPDSPDREYLEQLAAIRAHQLITDPPMPEATILLTVPFLGALGITDEPAQLVGSSASSGPVPESIARKLTADAGTFLRVLTDPISGEPLGLNPQRYRMRESEKAVLRALAQGCYYLNCTNPVMDTETDHVTAWEKGGATTAENMRPACKRHHLLRHFKDDKDRHGNYRVDQDPDRHQIRLRGWTPLIEADGRVGWISPSGKYHRPQNREPQRPAFPTWLKKRINKTLNPTRPDPTNPTNPASSRREHLILRYLKRHPR